MRFTSLRAPIRMAIPFSLRRSALFSSMDCLRTPDSSFDGEDEDHGDGSPVYRQALKFQRPAKIKWESRFFNSASLIGTVAFPPRVCATNDRLGAYTTLRVAHSRHSIDNLQVLLKMWDAMAEISLKHLKEKDLIYVSGILGSYIKAGADQRLQTYYEVIVRQLNYVAAAPCNQEQPSQSNSKSELQVGVDGQKEDEENHLHLWQVFFTEPDDWWDNRKNKRHERSPDFKNKHTKEALWICPNDPPWVRKQLRLLDSRNVVGRRSSVSTWEYDE